MILIFASNAAIIQPLQSNMPSNSIINKSESSITKSPSYILFLIFGAILASSAIGTTTYFATQNTTETVNSVSSSTFYIIAAEAIRHVFGSIPSPYRSVLYIILSGGIGISLFIYFILFTKDAIQVIGTNCLRALIYVAIDYLWYLLSEYVKK